MVSRDGGWWAVGEGWGRVEGEGKSQGRIGKEDKEFSRKGDTSYRWFSLLETEKPN